ncbi:alpha/beta hydrolase [Niallia endozanthoxylica]|uniref:Alpha/beta hydrolase n=1 Tax=Niallia endozanthoxylica TaxID=2036016 RepID=A0A5J5HLB6_9BACI|nr:alpha/beta hydrolase [Niallia endozanthoxylica]KAA9021604.1 alpha/beta hydrolase [Niallia endozanthoxylica]
MQKKGIWKKIRSFLLYSLPLLLFLLTIGFVYQEIGESRAQKKYTAVGETYDIYGKKMHIYTGGKGSSTVVFHAGSGTPNPYVDFSTLYDRIGHETKYAVIDRFGYGYSDLSNRKRDIDNIVDENRKLLQESGQKPPYILVGHSLSSLEVIRYAQRYPEEVSGIVLLDGGNPEYYSKQKPLTFFSHVLQFLRTTGLFRFVYEINEGFFISGRNNLKFVPNELKEIDQAFTLLKMGNKNVTDELRQAQKNATKVLKANNGLAMPIIVLTADSFGEIKQDWLESQKELTKWSSAGKQIVVKDSQHYIHHYRPGFIAEEILNLVKE